MLAHRTVNSLQIITNRINDMFLLVMYECVPGIFSDIKGGGSLLKRLIVLELHTDSEKCLPGWLP